MSARQGEERGRGIPRSEEERQERHEKLYPGTPLPERGYGLSGNEPSKASIITVAILGVLTIVLLGSRLKK